MNGKDDCEALMSELLDFAEKMLVEYGEFHPFGGFVQRTGAIVHVGVDMQDLDATSQEEADLLFARMKDHDPAASAFGVVTHVSISDDDHGVRDVVKVFLEHERGYCADVFLPYEIAAGKVSFVDVFAQQGDHVFFPIKH